MRFAFASMAIPASRVARAGKFVAGMAGLLVVALVAEGRALVAEGSATWRASERRRRPVLAEEFETWRRGRIAW